MIERANGIWRLESVPGPDMKFWAEMLGDPNPIHLDPRAARELGFGDRTVNPGPANLAYALNLIADAFGGATPYKLEARFLGNVMAGDAVEAEFQSLSEKEGELSLRRMPSGEAVLEANFVMTTHEV